MTWEQYWFGDVWMIQAYREAEKRRIKRIDEQAWLQGLYFYEALCDASPIFHDFAKKGTKPIPYRTEPYTVEQERQEKQRKQREKNEALLARIYMKQFVQAGKNWGKK